MYAQPTNDWHRESANELQYVTFLVTTTVGFGLVIHLSESQRQLFLGFRQSDCDKICSHLHFVLDIVDASSKMIK